jgi:hypothetical protein
MEDSIYLYSRGDRLGSHLLQYLSIIIYAFYNNLYIVYDPKRVNYNDIYEYEGKLYPKSFIVESLLVWIDKHNKRFPVKDYLLFILKDIKTEEYFGTLDVYENEIEDIEW